jgi:hypothetical protein
MTIFRNTFILFAILLHIICALDTFHPLRAKAQTGSENPEVKMIQPEQREIASGDDVAPQQREHVERVIARDQLKNSISPSSLFNMPQPYPFYPRAGNFLEDLLINSFVDLDRTFPGILDWNCGTCTYEGHLGEDSPLRGFQQQDTGVPVYAALDGIILDAHDGEPDRNQSSQDVPANYVMINHGNIHYSMYFHLRKDSVSVKTGDFVRAGTQIGLIGSSGISGGPHLHFETRMLGTVFEPFSGICRSGEPYFTNQPSLPQSLTVRDYYFSTGEISFDSPRLSTFVSGTQGLYFSLDLMGMTRSTNGRATIIKPDGSTAMSFELPVNVFPCMSMGFVGFLANINLNMPGAWKVFIEIENQPFLDATFTVVSTAAEIINHPPLPVTTAVEPVAPTKYDVIFCRVGEPKVIKDPDNDRVHYRYQWSVNGTAVRDVTIAARSDALAKGQTQPGDRVACTVTPTDGRLWGTSTSADVFIESATPKVSIAVAEGKVLYIAGENFDSGALIFINGVKQKTANQPESPNTRLIGKKAGKQIKPGYMLQIKNPDGAISPAFIY